MADPVFLVDPDALDRDEAVLGHAESHHLRVRRLRPGSPVLLGYGRGRQRPGIVVAITAHEAIVRLTDAPTVGVESPCHITLAQAALKADKLDFVVEKVTELGAAAVVIYTCARSLGAVSASRRDRWERIARSAAKQCRRAVVPEITGPLPWEAVVASQPPARRLLFLEPESTNSHGSRLDLRRIPPPSAVLSIVGPEGGFAPAEVQLATEAGCEAVSLGTRILRAETAAIVATTLCQFLWGDLGSRTP